MSQKDQPQFQIVSSRRSTTHESYHTGALNLSNLSAVLVDGNQAKIDLGLIHAKSKVERGIRFTSDRDEIEDGKRYWVVWVAVGQNEQGSYYAGVTASEMVVNHEQRRGWKNLADHVNRMDSALKKKIQLDGMADQERQALRTLLEQHDESMWENSTEELKQGLASE